MAYRLTKNSNGTFSLIHENGGREVRLHSTYDPVKEAERSVESYSAGRSSVILVLGMGLAYHVAALKKKFPQHKIIAVEMEREVFDIALRTCPECLESVYVATSHDELISALDSFDITEFTGIAKYYHRPSYGLSPSFYDGMVFEANKYTSSRISDLLTRFEFEEKWVHNIFKNIQWIYKAIHVKDFFGKFKGYSAVIVSAGPSLRKNVKLLREIKDKALVVAVDTAFPVLHKLKIYPHFVMVLDAQKHSLKHFLGTDTSKSVLLADIVSYPRVLDTYKGYKVLSTTVKYYTDDSGNTVRETSPFVEWVEKNSTIFGDIQSGGSVATSLFDFVLNLGCDQIVLLGQDLAYTGREIHSSGTYHNDDWLPMCSRFLNLDTINQNVVRRRKIKYVEAYGKKDTVLSDFVLSLYREWFIDSCSRVKVKVVNSTSGGASIPGAEEKSLADVIMETAVPPKNPLKIIENIINQRKVLRDFRLVEALQKARADIISINEFAVNFSADQARFEELFGMVSTEKMTPFYSVYLKKVRSRFTRKKTDEMTRMKLLSSEVIRSSSVLLKLLDECLLKINNIS